MVPCVHVPGTPVSGWHVLLYISGGDSGSGISVGRREDAREDLRGFAEVRLPVRVAIPMTWNVEVDCVGNRSDL